MSKYIALQTVYYYFLLYSPRPRAHSLTFFSMYRALSSLFCSFFFVEVSRIFTTLSFPFYIHSCLFLNLKFIHDFSSFCSLSLLRRVAWNFRQVELIFNKIGSFERKTCVNGILREKSGTIFSSVSCPTECG